MVENPTRRSVIRKGALATVGLGTIGGLVSDSARAASNATLAHRTNTVDGPNGHRSVGAEISLAGPASTSTETNRIGFVWGLSSPGSINSDQHVYIEDLQAKVKVMDGNSIGTYQYHVQDNNIPYRDELEYALDVLWSLADVPIPHPLGLIEASNTKVNSNYDMTELTVDYGTVYDGEIVDGINFLLHYGTDGDIDFDKCWIKVELTGDVYYSSTYDYRDQYWGELDFARWGSISMSM